MTVDTEVDKVDVPGRIKKDERYFRLLFLIRLYVY
jgi:hypothetical protein